MEFTFLFSNIWKLEKKIEDTIEEWYNEIKCSDMLMTTVENNVDGIEYFENF